jgi:hypothetical protein
MTGHPVDLPAERPNLPDRAAFWRWVADALRPLVGWLLVVLGGVALLLGWFGVSGQSLTAKQLPYLVSGGLVGIALIVIAAVFLATDDFRRQMSRINDLERKVNDLYTLLVEAAGEAPPAQRGESAPAASWDVMALPSGSSYHRASCALVAGKPEAVSVSDTEISGRRLSPCRVCSPEPVTAGRR